MMKKLLGYKHSVNKKVVQQIVQQIISTSVTNILGYKPINLVRKKENSYNPYVLSKGPVVKWI